MGLNVDIASEKHVIESQTKMWLTDKVTCCFFMTEENQTLTKLKMQKPRHKHLWKKVKHACQAIFQPALGFNRRILDSFGFPEEGTLISMSAVTHPQLPLSGMVIQLKYNHHPACR